jgi:ABC-type nitrate/sulfonate/bicarbonate transport system, permease component
MGSKRLHMWFKVILPAALPFIVSGMKQGWAFAWRSLMAAEIFVTILTGFGLGQLLHYGRELNAMEQVIGIMIVIVVIGLLADKFSSRRLKDSCIGAGVPVRHDLQAKTSARVRAARGALATSWDYTRVLPLT